MSLYVPSAGGIELLKRTLYGRGQSISAASGSPAVITSNAHGLANGVSITIAGATGNTNINGTFIVGNQTTNTFEIYPTAQGTGGTAVNSNGSLGGTPYWTLNGMENLALKLFSSNTTPAESDVFSTYTELANGSGYTTGGQALNSLLQAASGGQWAVPATVSGGGTGGWALTLGSGSTNVPESTYTQLTWSWTGTVMNNYGYFVVGANSGILLWVERYTATPKNYSSGDILNLVPRLGTTHV